MALENLRQSQELNAYQTTESAIKLLEDYLIHRRKAESERALEYEQAVLRIRRSMLTMEYLPRLKERKIEKDLRKKVMKVAGAYSDASNGDTLELASSDEASELKQEAVKSLTTAVNELTDARDLLGEDDSEYAAVFRYVAKELCERLREYRSVWDAIETGTPKGRLEGADNLRAIEDKMLDAVADLEVMIFQKPWQVGLVQGRLAKNLAKDQSQILQEDWYKQLKVIVEQEGEKAIADANWYDAVRAYSGLKQIEPENETYMAKYKTALKHARMVSLYGYNEGSEARKLHTGERELKLPPGHELPDSKSKPSGSPLTRPVEARTTWRELVAGVDAETVRNAISEMDRYYVTAVDYRKVGRGSLESIRILAETPEAVKAFPGLADEKKRNAFLKAIASISDRLDNKDRLDHIDVQRALNSILLASDRTVKIPVEVLAVEFAEGVLKELDKFSSMIWPYDVPDFRKQMTGRFYGVGIQITKEPGESLKVMMPLAGTPAYRLGIKAGDTIEAVDGKRTYGISIEKLVRMITGKKGTRVVLSIKRQGRRKVKDFSITREEIRIQTIKGWQRLLPSGEWDFLIDPSGTIGYIRLTQFTEQTPRDIAKILDKLSRKKLHSLILDMRFNPGGLLGSAARVANEFLRSGRVVSTRGRPTRPTEISADSNGMYLDGDLVVLVNQISASAAEIVAGAIKDWRRGIIVGERTYGKGSVQNVIQIPHKRQAVLKLTTAHYYLPSGRLLHRKNGSTSWGVDPDIAVLQTPKQMKRWLDIRRKTDLIQDIDPQKLKSDLSEQFEADLQLNTAVLLLKLMQLSEHKLAA